MKEILYNYDLLNDDNIDREIRRAKALIINSNNEILLCYGNNNYQLPGGHVENDETVLECLSRELMEETGIEISIEDRKPFLVITYMNKDYPNVGINFKTVANYYLIKTDIKPDLSKTNLTTTEKDGNFELKYISKDIVLQELENSLLNCTRKGVVLDTIEAIKTYLNIIK